MPPKFGATCIPRAPQTLKATEYLRAGVGHRTKIDGIPLCSRHKAYAWNIKHEQVSRLVPIVLTAATASLQQGSKSAVHEDRLSSGRLQTGVIKRVDNGLSKIFTCYAVLLLSRGLYFDSAKGQAPCRYAPCSAS